MSNTVATLAAFFLSTTLFGGAVVLNGVNEADATVAITESVSGDTVAVGNCVSSVCTLAGTGSAGGFTFPWSITGSPIGFGFLSSTTPTTGLFFANSEFFTVSDSTDGGGDDVTGNLSFIGFEETGANTATIFGTATAEGGELNFNTPVILEEFDALLTLAGFSFNTSLGIPIPEGSVIVQINLTNCMTGGEPSDCFPDPQPETITGTVNGVGLSSIAPEPGTLLLTLAGLAGLALVRRRFAA